MAVNQLRTLKEIAQPTLDNQPFSIKYALLDIAFEIIFGMIHLLAKFPEFSK